MISFTFVIANKVNNMTTNDNSILPRKEIVMFADEELVMELLVNAGQARSDAMEAIRCAGQKRLAGRNQLMASSESACLQAFTRFRPH